jgi:pSer/pThr/pTyr-binding forkhead associated (FHA) protein
MALVTFQVLDGLEMGHVFADLPTPISIGREDDNHIRLNDERVSRFHAKIQEDAGRVILTDLDSTNGTRVNGHPIRMRVLQIGDQVLIGRCLLLYGSAEQVAKRSSELAALDPPSGIVESETKATPSEQDSINGDPELPGELFPNGAPELPKDLNLGQAADLSEVLNFIHSRLLKLLLIAQQHGGTARKLQAAYMSVPPQAWMQLTQLEAEMAKYLRALSDPKDL